jgi:hypothetical protein
MNRFASTMVLAALAAATVPAAAGAKGADALRGARLQKAVGHLTISESRCPPGAHAASDCGHAKLIEDFGSGAKPRTATVGGRPGFPLGARINGRGTGACTMESAPTIVTGPDGSAQFLGSASRIVPGRFRATKVVARNGKGGVRVAWLEPLVPAIGCTYFDDRGTRLAVPAAGTVPAGLVSPVIAPRVLRRARFSVRIAGSQEWTDQAPDGTQVSAKASWRLRLAYKR